METQFDQLLQDYRSIWNNRLLINENISSEEILLEAIKREIYDENSHPRIRRSHFEKFYFATQRLITANISDESKNKLIQLHIKVMEEKK
jgi:hypothetical protein